MKKTLFLIFFFGFGLRCLIAGENGDVEFPPLDKSPVDLVYFPLKSTIKGTLPDVKLCYSRPSKRERVIFGELVPYGNVWRAGANESTEIRFYRDVMVGGTRVNAGIYSLFIVPEKSEWEIVINKDTDKWGEFSYNSLQDVARVKVPTKQVGSVIEYFSATFKEMEKGAVLVLGWENTMVELPLTFVEDKTNTTDSSAVKTE